ncbi:transposase [Chryseobacterium sp. MA9]|nr:transposase [Chryseobacterium sp. MA9]
MEAKWNEGDITMERACKFFSSTESEIQMMLREKTLDSDRILKWCKLLEYDFFRIYSQHLILYSPPSSNGYIEKAKEDTNLPLFKKNLYTREIIEFLIELVNTGEKTKLEIIKEYKIPKTTLYKWIDKYSNKV